MPSRPLLRPPFLVLAAVAVYAGGLLVYRNYLDRKPLPAAAPLSEDEALQLLLREALGRGNGDGPDRIGPPSSGKTLPVRPLPPTPADPPAVAAALKDVGTGVKLVPTDIKMGKLEFTMQLPEGAEVKSDNDSVRIEAGKKFSLIIQPGNISLRGYKEKWQSDQEYPLKEIILDGPDLIMRAYRYKDGDHDQFSFMQNRTLGPMDVHMEPGYISEKIERSDMLLMVKCARTATMKADYQPIRTRADLEKYGYWKDATRGGYANYDKTTTDTTFGLLAQLEPERKALFLRFTSVGEEGMRHVAAFKQLKSFDGPYDNVEYWSRSGLEYFQNLSELNNATFLRIPVRDEDLVYLKDLTNLQAVNFMYTKVTGSGFKHLQGMNLIALGLTGSPVTDEGLMHLRGMKAMQGLHLDGTQITDAGLEALKDMAKLEDLKLEGTKVTGSGFSHLAGLTALKKLHLRHTKVNNDGLKTLPLLTQVGSLELDGTEVSGPGLAALRSLPALTSLVLKGRPITDDDLKHLAGLANLSYLDLSETAITDEGLKHLQGLSKLTGLNLEGTRVSDRGLQQLAQMKTLDSLYLNKTPITNAGLDKLAVLDRLTTLGATDTRVTTDGTDKLKKALPKLSLIFVDSSPRSVATLPPLPAEMVPDLARQLTAADPADRIRAIQELGRMGGAAHSAIPSLILLLDDPEPTVRKPLLQALADIGRKALGGNSLSGVIYFHDPNTVPSEAAKQLLALIQAEKIHVWFVDVKRPHDFWIDEVPALRLILNGDNNGSIPIDASETEVRKLTARIEGSASNPARLDLNKTVDQAWVVALLLGLLEENQRTRFVMDLVIQDHAAKIAPALVQVIQSKYPAVLRGAAARALTLRKEGEPLTEPVRMILTKLVKDPKEAANVRGYAAIALIDGPMLTAPVQQALSAALTEGTSEELRTRAVARLAETGGADALSVLRQALADKSEAVRRSAVVALGNMGPKAAPALGALLPLTRDNDIRREAYQAINQIAVGKEAVPALVQVLQDKDPEARIQALDMFRRLDDFAAAADGCARALKDEDPRVRLRAALILADLGEHEADVLPIFIDMLVDDQEQYQVTEGLRQLGGQAVPALVKYLSGTDQPLAGRLRATRVLAGLDYHSKAAAPLGVALRSDNPQVKLCAALVLARRTPRDPAVLAPLLAGLKDKDPQLRAECASALGATQAAAVMPALLDALQDGEENVRVPATEALLGFSPDDSIIPRLIELLKKEESRSSAAALLQHLGVKAAPAVPALLDALKGSDAEERRTFGEALGSIGKPAIAGLLKVVDDAEQDEAVRAAALQALGQMGPAGHDAASALEKYLKDDSKPLQRQAAITLAQLGSDTDIVPVLLEALQDKDRQVAYMAQGALLTLGPRAASAFDRLAAILHGGDRQQQYTALNLLVAVQPSVDKTLPVLLPLLRNDADPNFRNTAAMHLGQFGSGAVPALVQALNAPSMSKPDVLWALQAIGPDAGPAVPNLVELLQDKDRAAATRAAQALAAIDPKQEAAVPVLVEALQSAEDDTKGQVLTALAQIGPRARPAVPTLMKLLPEPRYRYQVCHVLGRIGPDAVEAVPALRALLRAKDNHAPAAALQAIGPAAGPAVPELLKMLERDRTRYLAAVTLSKIGGDAKQAVPLLVKQLADPDQRLAACAALGHVAHLDPDSALPAILKLATDPDVDCRSQAVSSLGMTKSAQAVPALIKALEDPEPGVRADAAQALGQLGAAAAPAVPALQTALKAKELELRRQALSTLGTIGPAAAPALPEIIAALDDKDLLRFAVSSLGNLGATAAPAVPRLTELLDDPDIRFDVVHALGVIGPAAKSALAKLKQLETSVPPQEQRSIREAIRKIEAAPGSGGGS